MMTNMALLSDIRRVFRSTSRARTTNRELRRIADNLELIAKGLAVVVKADYEIDLYAPDTDVDSKDEMMPSYVNDREQAIREREQEVARALGQTHSGEPGELEKLLDEIW